MPALVTIFELLISGSAMSRVNDTAIAKVSVCPEQPRINRVSVMDAAPHRTASRKFRPHRIMA
jgi:hypothetical protein